jgi:LPPG:FO 2-phospho-L-lactate transferase
MKILALAGGVGGAKLVDGISKLTPDHDLTVVVNTGDDFFLYGLMICPDLDTVCYNLAGLENTAVGWGRDDESWVVLEELTRLGGPDWFQLGDRDLATHLERTRRYQAGETLSEITADFCRRWGITAKVLPMSDDPVPTRVMTTEGDLAFQDYFVKMGADPQVTGFIFQGAEQAHPAPGLIAAVGEAEVVIICPSNPWVSIDPILSVPGIRQAVREKSVLAVSPIIGGKAVKGPAAKMFREMGIEPSAAAVAKHYQGLITGLVVDEADRSLAESIARDKEISCRIFCTDTLMESRPDRMRVANQVLSFSEELTKEV